MTKPIDDNVGDNPALELYSLQRRINLQLAAMGLPGNPDVSDGGVIDLADDLLRRYRHQKRLLSTHRCPADLRIQHFLGAYFQRNGVSSSAQLPSESFILDQANLAREMSLPVRRNEFKSAYISSYRTPQGVLHNPRADRRTTKGVFHIVEGGLAVPGDKKAVPVETFARLLEAAVDAPADLLSLPFTAGQDASAHTWVSLYLRPLVFPEIPGVAPAKTMETRFFAPGGLVSNLDFIERIFGNAGDPLLPENDAALDIEHWCGTTGCVILAPHLVKLRKQALGLPHVSQASERQRADGMCWEDENERYNGGEAFKVVCRDRSGVVVTIIADNYFGYSKKEVKSQISYSTNLYGGCEEEHAGGALAFPSYNLGDVFQADGRLRSGGHTLAEAQQRYGRYMDCRPEGYAVDRRYPSIIYVPEDVRVDLHAQRLFWQANGEPQELKLLVDHSYVHPSGYRFKLEKDEIARAWRLVGTEPEGLFCHKPSTVSGGGKSEISKSIGSALLFGPVYVKDIHEDLDQVDAILRKDYSKVRRAGESSVLDVRSLLSPLRSLGSVIRLLTPSSDNYDEAYNAWLRGIPQHIRALVFLVKRLYEPEWGENWRQHFSVDMVNGHPTHELRFKGRKLITSYIRVGFEADGSWRVFKLRQDFAPAEKIQMEDDISVSAAIPAAVLDDPKLCARGGSLKFVANCEQRLFQRPDEAVIRGADVQTERDFAEHTDNFISNFEPLTGGDARRMVDDAVELDKFTPPMQAMMRKAATLGEDAYFVSSAHPRLVDGKPSKNVRYLQRRPDLERPAQRHLAEMGIRLNRRLPASCPVLFPVDALLPGRRNNPPEPKKGIRPLAVYGPIHFQELPELFMDYVASLSGKSPSTTGAGSEGAMTKGPFNALTPTADLNTALVEHIISGHAGFSTATGHIGPHRRVDHDISMLIPEIWCRLPVHLRDPDYLIRQGYLEKVEDFQHRGQLVRASRLGYRITDRFVYAVFGKVFDAPLAVFDEAMLKPETQDLEAFVDGVNHIVEAQQRVAEMYLRDATVEFACEPLKALLQIMAGQDTVQGWSLDDPAFRRLFTRDGLREGGWYAERLKIKRRRDQSLWRRHVDYLQQAAHDESIVAVLGEAELQARMQRARDELERVSDPAYLEALQGTLGADWLDRE
jgi:hypothetical protein